MKIAEEPLELGLPRVSLREVIGSEGCVGYVVSAASQSRITPTVLHAGWREPGTAVFHDKSYKGVKGLQAYHSTIDTILISTAETEFMQDVMKVP